MPRIVIKPQKDVNEYVIWSTVSQYPVTRVMNRDETFQYLVRTEGNMAQSSHERIQRADQSGLCIRYDRKPRWDSEEYIRIDIDDRYLTGWVKFKDIAKLANAIHDRSWTAIYDLVTSVEVY